MALSKTSLTKSDLHNYQKVAVQHIIKNPFCGLFLDMGLGKTVSTLTAISFLMYEDLEIDSVLIIAPKRVAESVWSKEIAKWEHLRHLTISKVIGNQKQRKSALAKKADIYIIGRDNISWLIGYYGGSRLPFQMCVIDELSSFKNPKSLRFKSLKNARNSFSRIVGLTGTPAPNGLMDLWSQIYLLDGGERLGKYIGQYRGRYFNPGRRNGMVIFNYDLKNGSHDAIYRKIDDIVISMKAEDYLELPGVLHNNVELDLGSEILQKYREFEREQVLELFEDNTNITAVNAAALSNKLLQFAGGSIYDEDGKVHIIHDAKVEACKELIDDANGQPVLIAYAYQSERDRLMEALSKYKPRLLKSEKDEDDWNAGNIQVLIMHPASGGHGLNIQDGGHRIIWFGHTWSLELQQQLDARLNRQGQKNVVIINRLISMGTIDQDVINSQFDKAKVQDRLINAVKARIEKYLR